MKYLVVEQDFEYNDSTYDVHEGYNIASKLYDTKEEAEKIAKERNDLMSEEITDWNDAPIKPYKVVRVEE